MTSLTWPMMAGWVIQSGTDGRPRRPTNWLMGWRWCGVLSQKSLGDLRRVDVYFRHHIIRHQTSPSFSLANVKAVSVLRAVYLNHTIHPTYDIPFTYLLMVFTSVLFFSNAMPVCILSDLKLNNYFTVTCFTIMKINKTAQLSLTVCTMLLRTSRCFCTYAKMHVLRLHRVG